MDDVEKNLLSQQMLLSSFSDKVKRSINTLDREVASLDAVRDKLQADLKDKVGICGLWWVCRWAGKWVCWYGGGGRMVMSRGQGKCVEMIAHFMAGKVQSIHFQAENAQKE